MLTVTHPTGNTFVRALVHGLEEENLMYQFHTCLASGIGISGKIIQRVLKEQSQRRSFDLPKHRITTHPLREAVRLLASHLHLSPITAHEFGWASIDAVYQSLDLSVSRGLEDRASQISAVYGFEDGALHTFREARRIGGIKCFYDLPIAYWRLGREILMQEADLEPDWAMTIDGLMDSPEKLERKDQELALADAVFCASSFTKNSLKLYPDELKAPIYMIPYGSPDPVENSQSSLEKHRALPGSERPLKVLFLGGLSQRKGLSYLFAAVDKLGKSVELTIIGKRVSTSCPALEKNLAKHRYIESLPHNQVLEEMGKSDVFIFPSLFEGFGLVLLEAMSQGVVCITTPHTAGSDFITDGTDGYIVPVRDSDSIVEKVLFLKDNPDELSRMKHEAVKTASRQTWKRYQANMISGIRNEL